MINFLRRLLIYLEVPSLDPDNLRRARLLNILLIGLLPLVSVMTLLLAAELLFHVAGSEDLAPTFWACVAFLAGSIVALRLNKIGKVQFASTLFLMVMSITVATANIPALLAGATTFYFVIPVMIASVLIAPLASFAAALFIFLMLGIIGGLTGVSLTFYLSAFPVLAIAFVSWLTTRNLENALKELRLINRELDKRVNRRTHELAEANLQLEDQAHELSKANSQLEDQARELARANLRLEDQARELYKANTRLEKQTHELSDANDKLKSLDRLKTKFVSDVTHELRTPISNLTIYMEMLRLGKIERQARYISVIEEEIARLAQLVEDVLDLTRMELGTKKTELRWVDFNQVIEQVVVANRLRAEAKGLVVLFEPGDGIPPIWADGNQLKQVATNLIGNAINYTLKGQVKVTTAYNSDRERVMLRIEDTGMGIQSEDLPHLFERFYRGIQASQSSIPGTGLGLSITREIVEAHRGWVEVKSQLGVGSIFSVFLPVSVPDPDVALQAEENAIS